MPAMHTTESASPTKGAESANSRLALPWLGRFLLLASVWGSSFLFIKVADATMAPLHVALGRMLLGSATLAVVLAARRIALPRGLLVWRRLAVAAFLLNALPFALFAYGETRTSSVLAGILNATTPLFAFLFALFLLRGERPRAGQVVGIAAGFLGVLVTLGAWRGFSGQGLAGNFMCLGAAACYGCGYPYTRKYLSNRTESIVALAAGQLFAGTLELAVAAAFLARGPAAMPPIPALASIAALGVLGTGLAYVLNYSLIRDGGVTAASTVTYVVPLLSTLEGALVLGERLTWYEPVGAAIVLVGVAASQGRLRRTTRPRRPGSQGPTAPSPAISRPIAPGPHPWRGR